MRAYGIEVNTQGGYNMNKTILVILASFFSLMIAIPFHASFAETEGMSSTDMDGMRKKRYRYRKRTHRVQVGATVTPWNQESDKNLFVDLDLLYGYNAGHFELGPNIGINNPGNGRFNLNLEAGIWGEFNMIKNTRKEKVVPAIGLKANYLKMGNDNDLLLSPYLAVKYFPASRTGLVVNFSYDIITPFDKLFNKMSMGINVSLAYAHYFHF